MLCPNCGANVSRKNRFCQECGSPQEQKNFYAEKVIPNTKWIALGYVGLYVLCILLCVLSVTIKPVIKLNEYLTVNYAGYEDYGSVNVSLDITRLAEDHGKKLAFGQKDEEARYRAAENFASYISVFTDTQEYVSNGDIVTCSWGCNEEMILENFGVKVKYAEEQFTVEGLEQPQAFDPFAGMEVQFEGIEPYGEAMIVGTASHAAANDLYYYLDTQYDLTNGMEVTMHMESYYDDLEEFLVTNYGLLPTCQEKTFPVSGLDYYVSALESVSADAMTAMQTKAAEVFSGTLTGEYEELKAFNLYGTYLVTDTENVDSWFNNRIYLVYQVQIQNDYPAVEAEAAPEAGADSEAGAEAEEQEVFSQLTEYYWFISFDNLLTNETGEVMFDVEYYDSAYNRFTVDSGISTGWFSTMRWTYYGYETVDALYDQAIADMANAYACVSNVAGSPAG